MMESVKERERLESHLEKLRDTRGKKLLDGQSTKAVTHAIKETVEGLDGIEDVAREAERRAQIEAKERRAIERAKAKTELQAVREEIVIATKAAHEAAKELVKQLRLIPELYESARVKAVALGDKIPNEWAVFEVVSRFGFRLASMFSTISARNKNRLGPIQWSLHGNYPATQDWVERETKILGLENDK